MTTVKDNGNTLTFTSNTAGIPNATTGYSNVTSGYTCGGCGQWVSTDSVHYCASYPQTIMIQCPYCKLNYSQGTYHTCANYHASPINYNLITKEDIQNLFTQLLDVSSRLKKIEKILDEEL